MEQFFNEHIIPLAKDLLFALIVLIVGVTLIRLIKKYLPKSRLFKSLDPSAGSFILSTIKILLYIFLVIIIISILGVPTTSIVAAISSALLAVGLALQGALSNFAGGIMLLVFRPFAVGDYITCTGGTGTVKEISVFYTSIATDDNTRLTVPNGTLMNDSVINHTAEDNRRVVITFSAAYDVDVEILKSKLVEFVNADNRVFFTPAPDLKISEYLDNGIRFSFRFWCSPENYWDLYHATMNQTKEILSELGVSAPTAKMNININQ